jgi:transcription elongation factor Elf1
MATCPQCTSSDLVSIAMALKGGRVNFSHCRTCEHRWWVDAAEGVRLVLPDVLHRVA